MTPIVSTSLFIFHSPVPQNFQMEQIMNNVDAILICCDVIVSKRQDFLFVRWVNKNRFDFEFESDNSANQWGPLNSFSLLFWNSISIAGIYVPVAGYRISTSTFIPFAATTTTVLTRTRTLQVTVNVGWCRIPLGTDDLLFLKTRKVLHSVPYWHTDSGSTYSKESFDRLTSSVFQSVRDSRPSTAALASVFYGLTIDVSLACLNISPRPDYRICFPNHG